MNFSEDFIAQLQSLAQQVQNLLPPSPPNIDWQTTKAFRWRLMGKKSYLEAVNDLSPIRLTDLQGIDKQKAEITRNTSQFVNKKPANNVLLTGARGTGKSSLIKALLNEFSDQGLRVIEVDRDLLVDLPDIVQLIAHRPERFIIYCDDLSFTADDASYRALKTILDGSMHAGSENVLIYATSNRRHLLPEYMSENLQTSVGDDGELHPSEAIEDKISLSDRFGMWLSFYAMSQDTYLDIVEHWLKTYHLELNAAARTAALQWALGRGNRSGRSAAQFSKDWAGKNLILK
ncbi:MAG TPA: ATP-binding protein [Agitococcus sp.]|nr:ATP-binding protein [Agitococcus sp.]HNA19989.1 ATP-binding protein [Agitococcus sp.]HNB19125.1 ATP-binding protein [Agitococcus sp.]HNC85456.1 ATP-binding protein [Agitococcus sp.]HNG09932.1 ATP-binding protein [Agitococcus sp.]